MKKKKALCITGLIILGLVAAYSTVAFIVWHRASAELDALRAQGEPVGLADIVPPQIPEEENAAPLLMRAFDEIRMPESDTPEEKAWDKNLEGESLTPDEEELVRGICANNAEAIGLVAEALERPGSRFDVPYEKGIFCDIPYMMGILDAANLLSSKAHWEMKHSNRQEATRRIGQLFRLADCVNKRTTLLEYMIGISISQMGLERMRDLLASDRLNRKALEALLPLIASQYDPEGMQCAFKAKRCIGIATFRWAGSNSGRLKRMSQLVITIGNGTPTLDEPMPSGPLEFPITPWRIYCENDLRWYLQRMKEFMAAARKPLPESLDAIESFEDRFRQLKAEEFPFFPHVLTFLLMPSMRGAAKVEARFLAQMRMAQVGIALEVFKTDNGHYPESLNEIHLKNLADVRIDPFSGKDLIYKRRDPSYSLYSVGPNRVDDGGFEEHDERLGNKETVGDSIWRGARAPVQGK